MLDTTQTAVFIALTIAMALATIWQVRRMGRKQGARSAAADNREYFLAGGGLTWPFIAGSITLTNLSTDQLVGMRVSTVSVPADIVADPATIVNSPQAPVFDPSSGNLNMLLDIIIVPFLIMIISWALNTSPPPATLCCAPSPRHGAGGASWRPERPAPISTWPTPKMSPTATSAG